MGHEKQMPHHAHDSTFVRSSMKSIIAWPDSGFQVLTDSQKVRHSAGRFVPRPEVGVEVSEFISDGGGMRSPPPSSKKEQSDFQINRFP